MSYEEAEILRSRTYSFLRKYERGEVEKLLLFSEKFREEIENV